MEEVQPDIKITNTKSPIISNEAQPASVSESQKALKFEQLQKDFKSQQEQPPPESSTNPPVEEEKQ